MLITETYSRARFDVIEVLMDEETGETGFFQALAIIALVEIRVDGVYTNRNKKLVRNQLDQFIIAAELVQVRKQGGDINFATLPYPIYKYRVSARGQPKLFLNTFTADEIHRPACFPQVFPTTAQNNRYNSNCNKTENNLHVRFYGFDLKSCDPSMWNSTGDSKTSTAFFTADDNESEGPIPPVLGNAFSHVDTNIINFLLDTEALSNAAADLNLHDLATDTEEEEDD